MKIAFGFHGSGWPKSGHERLCGIYYLCFIFCKLYFFQCNSKGGAISGNTYGNMNIFVNISHPAHVHLFKNAIGQLSRNGHRVIVGARRKEFTTDLLRAYGIGHTLLTRKRQGAAGLLIELLLQQLKITPLIRKYNFDIMLQMNGIFNAPVGRLFDIPTLAFSDTENDIWANRTAFPLSSHVFSPTCFDHAHGGPWKNQILYPGYHELAYLAPRYLSGPVTPENRYLVRFVGWGAGHDIGETGLSPNQKIEIVQRLQAHGTVHVSSEGPIPAEIAGCARDLHPAAIHDFMRGCRMVVGESATMASEAACMGIPALFISNTGRGYTTEQDRHYGLIRHYRLDQWADITATLEDWTRKDLSAAWQAKRRRMLADKIDVTAWIVDLVENYPRSVAAARSGDFERYALTCAA